MCIGDLPVAGAQRVEQLGLRGRAGVVHGCPQRGDHIANRRKHVRSGIFRRGDAEAVAGSGSAGDADLQATELDGTACRESSGWHHGNRWHRRRIDLVSSGRRKTDHEILAVVGIGEIHNRYGAEHTAAGITDRRRADVASAALHGLKNAAAVVGAGHLPGHVHLHQALALVAGIEDAAVGLPHKRRTATLEAGEEKLPVAVIGVCQALQLVDAALQSGGNAGPVSISHRTVAGLDQQALDVLQDGGNALQAVFFERQGLRGLPATGRVLRVQRD